MMVHIKSVLVYMIMIVRSLLTKKRFVIITPSFVRTQLVFDKRKIRFMSFRTRDRIDWATLSQIYYSEDYNINKLSLSKQLYSHLDQIFSSSRIPLIVDLGANNGISVRYFADEYPKAKILAFEPNVDNFNLARINNKKIGVDIEWFNSAIGSENTTGRIVDPGIGNWGYRVEKDNEGTSKIIGLNDIIKRYDKQVFSPFIMKIDIEGFENELFSGNLDWIDLFPIIIIELHDWLLPGQNNSKNFLNAIANRNIDFVYIGENIFSIKT